MMRPLVEIVAEMRRAEIVAAVLKPRRTQARCPCCGSLKGIVFDQYRRCSSCRRHRRVPSALGSRGARG